MVLGALVLLSLAWLSRGDGWPALVWAVPGFFVLVQPVSGFVRGQAGLLRIGVRKIDVTGLKKVAVYNRKQWGYSYSVAVLKLGDRVEEISGAFLTSKSFTKMIDWLGITPEGTRKAVKHWKSGFLRIARAADVPILPVFIDYPTKTFTLGVPQYASGDDDADLARIRALFRGYRGKHRGAE